MEMRIKLICMKAMARLWLTAKLADRILKVANTCPYITVALFPTMTAVGLNLHSENATY